MVRRLIAVVRVVIAVVPGRCAVWGCLVFDAVFRAARQQQEQADKGAEMRFHSIPPFVLVVLT